MRVKGLQRWIIIVVLAVSCAFCYAGVNKDRLDYAKSRLAGADKDAQLRVVKDMDHREAFRVKTAKGKMVVEAATEAGLIYGAQAIAVGDYEPVLVEKPDFDIRGTTLCLMPGGYRATLSPELYPWFYDKEFMTRTLDSFAAARLNTIFLWAGHMFPYIVEMPDYPEASSDVPPEQVKANQEQFRWFTSECEKRNIKVLLHFYNIHVSPPFAKAHKMRTNPTTPTPLLKEYTHYALSRYFKEFASVGLYACPGESIHSKYQLEWFRDVIFDAAKKSGKNPEIVIRDWTQNMEFRDNIKNLYDNAYTEQKHNDESLTSPYPDVRIMQMEGIAAGHIVNFHLVTDLVPMRWGSPLMVQESMQNLKRLGFVKGVEFFGQTFWKWPYTLDKLSPSQKGYHPQGPKLLSLDRDAIYFKAFGRYLWRSDRDPRKEQEYWTQYLAKKFGSRKVGELLHQWYVTSGPIGPGLQNLNATKVAGWWPSVMLHNQSVDQILTYNKKLDETPYTLYRETGRAGQRFYPRPFDAFFFDRYRKTYSLPKPGSLPSMYKEFAAYRQRLGIDQLEQRHCMPVSQYAKALEECTPIDQAMTPDKTASLLNILARESLELAGNAVQHANHSGLTDENRKELERFVTDSRMYVLATEALLHKEQAAILKARMLITSDSKLAGQFLKHMEQSVVSYQKLAALTTTSYLHGNDLMKTHWKDSGLNEFQKDLTKQRAWIEKRPPPGNCKILDDGSLRIEAEWMQGPWRIGTDKYTDFEGTGYAASPYALSASEPVPLKTSVQVKDAGSYTVWVRALKGGAHQDRSLAVEVAGKRLKTTHQGYGSAVGEYTWEDAGTVTLPAGVVEIKFHPVGKTHPTADVIVLTPVANGQPETAFVPPLPPENFAKVDQYNVVWTSQSSNSGDSMPVSGGDIGLNVWVENNELMFYMGRAGYRDENGALLKPGRGRIKLTPNPFENGKFHQELRLREGYVSVNGEYPDGTPLAIKVWVEVARPIVHLDIESDNPITVEATYESWRTETIELPNDKSKHDRRAMCMINYDAYPGKVFLYKDEIRAADNLVRFHHRVDNSKDCFNFQVKQQELEPVRDQLVNPLENLVWGGALTGDNFSLAGETSGKYAQCPFRGWKYVSKTPARSHRVRVCLHIDKVEKQDAWDSALQELIDLSPQEDAKAWKENLKWWSDFWSRSHLVINSGRGEQDIGWRLGRNYQLFRYMLASNVSGREPTLFNGGLFTFDPLYVNRKKGPGYTPDHRQWGAAFTAQNQRLVYRPMLKTGDFDLMPSGFSFYLNGLPNAMARVRHYWKHDGCCFEEQSAITGLPGACQYGFFEGGGRGRPKNFEVGVQVNRAGGKVYEEQLDWSWLILQYHQFSGADIARYLPLIEQSVIFYDEHYRYRCKKLTGKELDNDGKLVIYPANTLEAHWDARNPTSVIAGLRRVLIELVRLPERYTSAAKKKRWQTILDRLPEMPTGNSDKFGGRYLKPSENHGHRSWHCPEMFPLYPYELYGLGLPDLELMKQTSLATGNHRYKTVAWQQANIHAARLGDTTLAQKLNSRKMDNGPYRFPAFWPHDIDWAPDHNWGGGGMIGMQEMLMQTHSSLEELRNGKPGTIRLLPAWPKEWDVDFKMHAPYTTTVEGKFRSGKMTCLNVTPKKRQNDVVLMNERKIDK